MTEIMFANEVSDYFVFRLDDGVFISTEVPENVWPPFLGRESPHIPARCPSAPMTLTNSRRAQPQQRTPHRKPPARRRYPQTGLTTLICEAPAMAVWRQGLITLPASQQISHDGHEESSPRQVAIAAGRY
jgi:hypothetical protein